MVWLTPIRHDARIIIGKALFDAFNGEDIICWSHHPCQHFKDDRAIRNRVIDSQFVVVKIEVVLKVIHVPKLLNVFLDFLAVEGQVYFTVIYFIH